MRTLMLQVPFWSPTIQAIHAGGLPAHPLVGTSPRIHQAKQPAVWGLGPTNQSANTSPRSLDLTASHPGTQATNGLHQPWDSPGHRVTCTGMQSHPPAGQQPPHKAVPGSQPGQGQPCLPACQWQSALTQQKGPPSLHGGHPQSSGDYRGMCYWAPQNVSYMRQPSLTPKGYRKNNKQNLKLVEGKK